MSEDITKRIEEAKAKLERIRQEEARAEGSVQAGLKRLGEEFQLASLDKAEKRLAVIEKEIPPLKDALEKELAVLEAELEGA